MRTKIGAATPEHKRLDRCLAAVARLTGPPIHVEWVFGTWLFDVLDLFAVLLAKSEVDRLVSRFGEPVPFDGSQVPRFAQGVNPGAKQRLCGMDISQARDSTLV